MVVPKVVGYKITGELDQLATSTDAVLTITKVCYMTDKCDTRTFVLIVTWWMISMSYCLHFLAFAPSWCGGKICWILWIWCCIFIHCWSGYNIKHVSRIWCNCRVFSCGWYEHSLPEAVRWVCDDLVLAFYHHSFIFVKLYAFCLGRDEKRIDFISKYLKANKMYRDYSNSDQDPVFTEVEYMKAWCKSLGWRNLV